MATREAGPASSRRSEGPASAAREQSASEFAALCAAGRVSHGLQQAPAARDFVRHLAGRGLLLTGALKREVSKSILAVCAPASSGPAEHKQSGLDVEDMVNSNPDLFRAGATPLPPGSHQLRPAMMLQWHSQVCASCTHDPNPTLCQLSPTCYFGRMLACIERGWEPPFRTTEFVTPYQVKGNYSGTDLYAEGVEKELLGSMLPNGAVRECRAGPGQVLHPLGAVLKTSE